jgi:hypothetical protein
MASAWSGDARRAVPRRKKIPRHRSTWEPRLFLIRTRVGLVAASTRWSRRRVGRLGTTTALRVSETWTPPPSPAHAAVARRLTRGKSIAGQVGSRDEALHPSGPHGEWHRRRGLRQTAWSEVEAKNYPHPLLTPPKCHSGPSSEADYRKSAGLISSGSFMNSRIAHWP